MVDDTLAEFARAILEVRRDRRRELPAELFGGELAYELLLILFIADARGERLTGKSALEQAGGVSAAGRRWIEYLTREKLIIGDGDGNLDDTLTLTAKALNALEGWLSRAHETFDGSRSSSNEPTEQLPR
ncbi:hypothetical protein SAMN05428950_10293 [Sphingomonas sp. OV641]|uniref:hypothetical protein n=1 Tax=Sphingomonas sp. OV641 TaxID=1881068 RepID=UPI0008BDD0FE|nr:hypothetical protein [Sphingomonas sp. OV641]SEJ58255.1 hypothetical protein SAMN05428950_10293 [Sphingomonas sp. OV641]